MISDRNKPKNTFISHAQADEPLARRLASELRKARFEPWLVEESVGPGDNVAMASGRALESSDAIVVLVSKSALKSQHVRSEWDYAIGSAKHAGRVVPVLAPGTRIESAPWIFKHLQHVRVGSSWTLTARRVVDALSDLPRAAG